MLLLVLSGCKTVESRVEYQIPTLTAFRPTLGPVGLIAEPQTETDLLLNSTVWEYWGYEWQDYGFSLEDWVEDLKILIEPG